MTRLSWMPRSRTPKDERAPPVRSEQMAEWSWSNAAWFAAKLWRI
jgi:hypothetical protein